MPRVTHRLPLGKWRVTRGMNDGSFAAMPRPALTRPTKLSQHFSQVAAFPGRIGPAQRRRQDEVDVAADRMARAGAEFERLEPAAQHRELVDGLHALVMLGGNPRS